MLKIANAVVLVAVMQALAGCGSLPGQPDPGDGSATGGGPGTPIGTVELAGNYTLTFVADSTCTAIPSALRTRTYSVTIAPASESAGYAAETLLLSAASDVPFWEDRNNFAIETSGDVVVFRLGDGEYGTQYFVEEVAAGQYVNFYAEQIRFSVGSTSVSTISIPFGGLAEYWGPAVANPVHCISTNHRMILTRR